MKYSPRNKGFTVNKTTSQRLLLWSIAIIAVVSIGQVPPISQDVNYHHFADKQTLFGIPNMWNVLSNFPFLLVGLYGLRYAIREKDTLQSALFRRDNLFYRHLAHTLAVTMHLAPMVILYAMVLAKSGLTCNIT